MMGRTLFWYIFRDLMKIFLMANGALAGIMSFGGLLRPLTHQGLDVGQIGKLLGYFNMAMLTYSMPIAALFATTVVYGRLSADNEVTACRAGGLSHLAVAFPAFVMGIVVALLSMVFLCFIVPVFTMKAEQTLYSNMAKLIAGRIQREHKIEFGQVSIYAQEAYIPPGSSNEGGQQTVVLKGPTIETIERPYRFRGAEQAKDPNAIFDPTYHVPKDFYTASEATISIEQLGKGQQRGTGKVQLTIRLENGIKFPREFQGAVQMGVEETEYGPIEIDSPMKEEPKFMDVWKLKRLYREPLKAQKVKQVVDALVRRDQQSLFAQRLATDLNDDGKATFRFGPAETFTLRREATAPAAVVQGMGEVIIPAAPPVNELAAFAASGSSAGASLAAAGLPPIPILPAGDAADRRPIVLQQQMEGQSPPDISAREAHLQVRPAADSDTLKVRIELFDSLSKAGNDLVRHKSWPQTFDVPMPPDVRAIGSRGLGYIDHLAEGSTERQLVGRILLVLSNQILAESHSRVSFAISCLVLVMVGCALGLMFRSGNFLSAFAVSFIPALVTITLIVAGQRVSGSIPESLKVDIAHYVNTPLQLGLALIWAGNCVNFVLAVVLLGRLQKK
jgi:lipopolysaccharide export LptBFGC system permease protein LptF